MLEYDSTLNGVLLILYIYDSIFDSRHMNHDRQPGTYLKQIDKLYP